MPQSREANVPVTEDVIREALREEIVRVKQGAVALADVQDHLPLFDVNEDDAENLGLDSLDALELAVAIEERLSVQLPNDLDFKEVPTIEHLVAYIARLSQRDGAGVP